MKIESNKIRHMSQADRLFLLCTLMQQSAVWATHALDTRIVINEARPKLRDAQERIDRFLSYVYGDDPEVRDQSYDISVNLSELIEDILILPDDKLNRVRGLVNKLLKELESQP